MNFPHVPEGMVIVRHRQAVRAKNLELKCFIPEVIRPNVCSVVNHIARLKVCEVMPASQGLRLLMVHESELEHVTGSDVGTRLKLHRVQSEESIITAAIKTSGPEAFSLVLLQQPVCVFA